jgi:hypothetical protein
MPARSRDYTGQFLLTGIKFQLMNTSQGVIFAKKPVFKIEWKLLVFLILIMDVKLVVKVLALVFICFMQPDLKFGFSIKNSRLPLFYLIVIGIAILDFMLIPDFSSNYILVVLTGILIWLACILAVHHIKLLVERTDITILHNTILVFFILNIIFSFINLSTILFEIGFRNPYLYQGQYQKYYLNTGDFIKGLSYDTSTTNAVINCFGTIYFLYRKKYGLVLASLITLILTVSNFSNICLTIVLIILFIFKSNREQKSIIVICIMLMIIFYSKFSPQNNDYLASTINKFILNKKDDSPSPLQLIPIRERPDSQLTNESRKEKIAVLYLDSLERIRLNNLDAKSKKAEEKIAIRFEIPKDKIHTPSFQWTRDTTSFQRKLLTFTRSRSALTDLNIPEGSSGKSLAFKQSYSFLKEHQNKILTGDGIGNFSSKLAYRATGLKIAGSFPPAYIYSNTDFLFNHFSLYAYFFMKPAESHSIIHNSASVYDQLLTEYGLIGIIAFTIFYIGFFGRKWKLLTYGLPLFTILLSFFLIDYWFEQISIVILFEFLMFLDIKEHIKPSGHA